MGCFREAFCLADTNAYIHEWRSWIWKGSERLSGFAGKYMDFGIRDYGHDSWEVHMYIKMLALYNPRTVWS